MRKWITYILLLAMVFSLVGCGRNNGTGSTEYSLQDLLLYQATKMAMQAGAIAEEGHIPGSGDEVNTTMKVFSAAAQPEAITAAAFLDADISNLPGIIVSLNAATLNDSQLACASYLRFYTQFYCPIELSEKAAVYLQYGNQCHFVVLFEPQAEQLVTATIYPLFSDVATHLMNTRYPNVATIHTADILSARAAGTKASFVAKSTGGSVNALYYTGLAKSLLSDASGVSKNELKQYTSNAAVLNWLSQFTQTLERKPVGSMVYTFPAEPDGISSAPATPNQLCAAYGEDCVLANSILQSTLRTNSLGAVHAEDEVPVIVALDYVGCTVLVIIYPNENNTYLTAITCLPCAFVKANALLAQNGAVKMA